MEIKIVISDTPTEGASQGAGITVTQATQSVAEPPAYLARAAAAIGARNGGPAPMLTGMTGGTPGEPVPFTSAAIASPVLAAAGAPDQSAGAAPGAERAAPKVTVEEEEVEEDEES
jgi:hypothetical protein